MNRLLIGMILLAAVGCGPMTYMSQVGVRANKAYAGAREVDAQHQAPYEYYAGYYYLMRARYKGGYADYGYARKYGRKSESMFRKAKRISIEKTSRGEVTPASTPAQSSSPKKKVILVPDDSSGKSEEAGQ